MFLNIIKYLICGQISLNVLIYFYAFSQDPNKIHILQLFDMSLKSLLICRFLLHLSLFLQFIKECGLFSSSFPYFISSCKMLIPISLFPPLYIRQYTPLINYLIVQRFSLYRKSRINNNSLPLFLIIFKNRRLVI